MRQRIDNLKRHLLENYPRTHKILYKSTEMLGWTPIIIIPIIIIVYGQILVLTYGYYKSAYNTNTTNK
jgi:hypothetical protein